MKDVIVYTEHRDTADPDSIIVPDKDYEQPLQTLVFRNFFVVVAKSDDTGVWTIQIQPEQNLPNFGSEEHYILGRFDNDLADLAARGTHHTTPTTIQHNVAAVVEHARSPKEITLTLPGGKDANSNIPQGEPESSGQFHFEYKLIFGKLSSEATHTLTLEEFRLYTENPNTAAPDGMIAVGAGNLTQEHAELSGLSADNAGDYVVLQQIIRDGVWTGSWRIIARDDAPDDGREFYVLGRLSDDATRIVNRGTDTQSADVTHARPPLKVELNGYLDANVNGESSGEFSWGGDVSVTKLPNDHYSFEFNNLRIYTEYENSVETDGVAEHIVDRWSRDPARESDKGQFVVLSLIHI